MLTQITFLFFVFLQLLQKDNWLSAPKNKIEQSTPSIKENWPKREVLIERAVPVKAFAENENKNKTYAESLPEWFTRAAHKAALNLPSLTDRPIAFLNDDEN